MENKGKSDEQWSLGVFQAWPQLIQFFVKERKMINIYVNGFEKTRLGLCLKNDLAPGLPHPRPR